MFFRDEVFEIFKDTLKNNGLSIKEKTDDGLYIVNVNGLDLSINLENIRRDFKRHKDPGDITRFVDNILLTEHVLPNLEDVRANIRFSLEPGNQEFYTFCAEPLTRSVNKVIVYTQGEERLITWINESHLEHWSISKNMLIEIANENMDKLLDLTDIQVKQVRNMNLAMFSTKFMAFKSSLILSPKFKEKVSPLLGWPVLAVIPARDFIFAFAEKDKDLIPLLGETIVREYNESSYPITKEVIRISDEGFTALGSF